MHSENRKKPSGRKILYFSMLGFFAVAFLCSAIYLISYFVRSQQASSEYDDLSNLRDQYLSSVTTDPTDPDPSQPTTPPPTDPSTGEVLPTEPTILPEQAPFYEMNSDMVGWITIPDTKINYPVLQTPGTEDATNYYLNHNFKKSWSDWGAIFASGAADINLPSDNITLYGHHMKDGSMFAGLDSFKHQSFWQDHQTFTFDTLYERHTYQIWATFKTSATAGKGLEYHNFINALDEQAFNDFVSSIQSLDFYDTGITPKYGDKLLLLSTCEYTLENGRFVVCAVRID